MEEDHIGEIPETQVERLSGSKNGSNGGGLSSSDDHDQLVQTVIELGFQNEYLKSQFEGFRDFQLVDPQFNEHEGVGELQQIIQSLNKQLFEERQTRVAAEEALKHLQLAHSEADARAQDLSLKLTQGHIFISLYAFFSFSFYPLK